MAGITKDGKKVEEKLQDLVESVGDNPNKGAGGTKKGDKIVTYRDTEMCFYIEVKKKTWNQCRPYKYLPTIGHNPETGDWFVCPPDDMVRMCIDKKGQHARDSLECCNHSVPKKSSKRWAKYACSVEELEERIWEAYEQGEENQKVKEYCIFYKQRLEERAEQTQLELQSLFG